MPIHVPALRERRDDIPALVRHFADLFARDNNFRRKTFTAAAMEKLKQQHWRGNIRELRNFVERLMIMIGRRRHRRQGHSGGRHHPRRPADADRRRAGCAASRRQRAVVDARADAAGVQVAARSARIWWRKLRENSWNISKTAEVIDTPRSNLYKKLEQYQISQETRRIADGI